MNLSIRINHFSFLFLIFALFRFVCFCFVFILFLVFGFRSFCFTHTFVYLHTPYHHHTVRSYRFTVIHCTRFGSCLYYLPPHHTVAFTCHHCAPLRALPPHTHIPVLLLPPHTCRSLVLLPFTFVLRFATTLVRYHIDSLPPYRFVHHLRYYAFYVLYRVPHQFLLYTPHTTVTACTYITTTFAALLLYTTQFQFLPFAVVMATPVTLPVHTTPTTYSSYRFVPGVSVPVGSVLPFATVRLVLPLPGSAAHGSVPSTTRRTLPRAPGLTQRAYLRFFTPHHHRFLAVLCGLRYRFFAVWFLFGGSPVLLPTGSVYAFFLPVWFFGYHHHCHTGSVAYHSHYTHAPQFFTTTTQHHFTLRSSTTYTTTFVLPFAFQLYVRFISFTTTHHPLPPAHARFTVLPLTCYCFSSSLLPSSSLPRNHYYHVPFSRVTVHLQQFFFSRLFWFWFI